MFVDLGFGLEVISILELFESPIMRLHLSVLYVRRASQGARVVVSSVSPMIIEIDGTTMGIPRPLWSSNHLREPGV